MTTDEIMLREQLEQKEAECRALREQLCGYQQADTLPPGSIAPIDPAEADFIRTSIVTTNSELSELRKWLKEIDLKLDRIVRYIAKESGDRAHDVERHLSLIPGEKAE